MLSKQLIFIIHLQYGCSLQVYQYGGYPPQFNPAFQPTTGGQQFPPAQSTPPTAVRTGPTPQVVISDEDVKVRKHISTAAVVAPCLVINSLILNIQKPCVVISCHDQSNSLQMENWTIKFVV